MKKFHHSEVQRQMIDRYTQPRQPKTPCSSSNWHMKHRCQSVLGNHQLPWRRVGRWSSWGRRSSHEVLNHKLPDSSVSIQMPFSVWKKSARFTNEATSDLFRVWKWDDLGVVGHAGGDVCAGFLSTAWLCGILNFLSRAGGKKNALSSVWGSFNKEERGGSHASTWWQGLLSSCGFRCERCWEHLVCCS